MTEKDPGTCQVRIELLHLTDRVVARIERNGRDKNYHRVTPASRARVGMYVFMHAKRFRIWPYVTGIVGWIAESAEEATE